MNRQRIVTGGSAWMLAVAIALTLPAVPGTRTADAAAQDTVREMVERIFPEMPAEGHVRKIVRDGGEGVYLGLHLANWGGVFELRCYRVPFREAEDRVRPLLSQADPEAAFSALLDSMGGASRYVADIGLDGIRDEAVAVGTASLKDNFHSFQFDSHEEADRAYRSWLRRAVELTR